jgi:lyso-ornithine lipid O-acyltransferase
MLQTTVKLFVLAIIWPLLIFFSTILYLLTFLPRALSGRYFHFLSRLWCRVFIRALDIDLRLVDKSTSPLPKQYILIANHPSALEDFALPALFDVYPLAKAGVRNWFILGRLSDFAGTLFVKRDNPESRHAALQSLIEAASNGKNLLIFPEGGCKGRCIYRAFKMGAFDISLQTGIPVLPVFLQYMDQDAFEWVGQTLPEKLWQIFKAKNNRVNYYLHDAVWPDRFNDKEAFSQHVHAQYLKWQKQYLDTL